MNFYVKKYVKFLIMIKILCQIKIKNLLVEVKASD